METALRYCHEVGLISARCDISVNYLISSANFTSDTYNVDGIFSYFLLFLSSINVCHKHLKIKLNTI